MTTESAHHPSVKGYLLVFAALGVLTGLTVFLAGLGLPHGTAVLLAIIIATTKCTLIGLFFMHLKSESKMIYVILAAGLVLVGTLILTLIPDIGIVK